SHEGYLTRYPIANGADIADHFDRMPDKFTISGVISDFPVIPGILGSFASITESIASKINKEEFRSTRAYNAMLNILNEPEIITLQTGMFVRDDILLTKFNVNRTLRTEGSLDVSLTFEQIRISDVETGSVESSVVNPADGQPPKANNITDTIDANAQDIVTDTLNPKTGFFEFTIWFFDLFTGGPTS
ncbi:unnamed protein product, partial [marine sediment metagenome]